MDETNKKSRNYCNKKSADQANFLTEKDNIKKYLYPDYPWDSIDNHDTQVLSFKKEYIDSYLKQIYISYILDCYTQPSIEQKIMLYIFVYKLTEMSINTKVYNTNHGIIVRYQCFDLTEQKKIEYMYKTYKKSIFPEIYLPSDQPLADPNVKAVSHQQLDIFHEKVSLSISGEHQIFPQPVSYDEEFINKIHSNLPSDTQNLEEKKDFTNQILVDMPMPKDVNVKSGYLSSKTSLIEPTTSGQLDIPNIQNQLYCLSELNSSENSDPILNSEWCNTNESEGREDDNYMIPKKEYFLPNGFDNISISTHNYKIRQLNIFANRLELPGYIISHRECGHYFVFWFYNRIDDILNIPYVMNVKINRDIRSCCLRDAYDKNNTQIKCNDDIINKVNFLTVSKFCTYQNDNPLYRHISHSTSKTMIYDEKIIHDKWKEFITTGLVSEIIVPLATCLSYLSLIPWKNRIKLDINKIEQKLIIKHTKESEVIPKNIKYEPFIIIEHNLNLNSEMAILGFIKYISNACILPEECQIIPLVQDLLIFGQMMDDQILNIKKYTTNISENSCQGHHDSGTEGQNILSVIDLRSVRPQAEQNVRSCCLQQLDLRSVRPQAEQNVRSCCLQQLDGWPRQPALMFSTESRTTELSLVLFPTDGCENFTQMEYSDFNFFEKHGCIQLDTGYWYSYIDLYKYLYQTSRDDIVILKENKCPLSRQPFKSYDLERCQKIYLQMKKYGNIYLNDITQNYVIEPKLIVHDISPSDIYMNSAYIRQIDNNKFRNMINFAINYDNNESIFWKIPNPGDDILSDIKHILTIKWTSGTLFRAHIQYMDDPMCLFSDKALHFFSNSLSCEWDNKYKDRLISEITMLREL